MESGEIDLLGDSTSTKILKNSGRQIAPDTALTINFVAIGSVFSRLTTPALAWLTIQKLFGLA